ncbi:hypothetical protein TRVL_09662 [Trypanosoma vivax]|nr:hypothetical protein TRVL_09662 [Trypanosoma vivax]
MCSTRVGPRLYARKPLATARRSSPRQRGARKRLFASLPASVPLPDGPYPRDIVPLVCAALRAHRPVAVAPLGSVHRCVSYQRRVRSPINARRGGSHARVEMRNCKAALVHFAQGTE